MLDGRTGLRCGWWEAVRLGGCAGPRRLVAGHVYKALVMLVTERAGLVGVMGHCMGGRGYA